MSLMNFKKELQKEYGSLDFDLDTGKLKSIKGHNMLELLALRHKEWVDMARAVGCPEPYAEDVVQEVYLRLYHYRENIYDKLILPDDEVNTFYMFVSIRNMVRTMMKNEGVYINYDEFYYEEADGC